MHSTEVPIDAPCHEDWGRMTGGAARRHCAACDKHVHDLSEMTERAARRLLERSPEVCVRYTCRSDGALVHRERRGGKRRFPRFLAVAAVVAAVPACGAPDAPPGERSFFEAVVGTVSAWLGHPAPSAGAPAAPAPVEPLPARGPRPPPPVLMGAPRVMGRPRTISSPLSGGRGSPADPARSR